MIDAARMILTNSRLFGFNSAHKWTNFISFNPALRPLTNNSVSVSAAFLYFSSEYTDAVNLVAAFIISFMFKFFGFFLFEI